jgi:hypothetical protein
MEPLFHLAMRDDPASVDVADAPLDRGQNRDFLGDFFEAHRCG